MMHDTRSASDSPCQWSAPDGAFSIVLESSLVDDLRRRTIEAFISLPKRGAEIGGLLFGKRRTDGTTTFQIDGCEEIPCEYRFGPSYRLSESDYRRLSERLVQLPQEGSDTVIGLYRSYTGGDVALDQADKGLLRYLFPDARFVLLLLQPISPEKCFAQFQFGSDGEIAGEGSYEQFLFEPSQLKSESKAPAEAPPEPVREEPVEAPKPAIAVMPLPASRRARVDEPEEDEAPPAPRDPRRWTLLWLCALAAIAGAAGHEIWRLEHEPRWAPLALHATASAKDVLLTWDAAAPAIQDASQGMMTVTDGASQNQVPLTAAQLRSGKFNYAPSHDEVLFRLLVYDASMRPAGDSLHVARLQPVQQATVVAPPSAPVPQPAAVQAAVPAPATSDPPRVASPAVVRHEVQAYVPAGIRARVHSRIVVPVQVHIDAEGRVTEAACRKGGSGLERYLADEAVKAARQWSFEPAHSREGNAVASVKSVEFVFTPAH
jgi:TonB family protein